MQHAAGTKVTAKPHLARLEPLVDGEEQVAGAGGDVRGQQVACRAGQAWQGTVVGSAGARVASTARLGGSKMRLAAVRSDTGQQPWDIPNPQQVPAAGGPPPALPPALPHRTCEEVGCGVEGPLRQVARALDGRGPGALAHQPHLDLRVVGWSKMSMNIGAPSGLAEAC